MSAYVPAFAEAQAGFSNGRAGPPARSPGFSSAADFDDLHDPVACIVRYSHLEREPGLLPYPNLGALDEQMLARLLGCELQYLRRIRSGFETCLDQACRELLADQVFERSVRALPFAAGDVVVTVGDSITADALSWAEMLSGALRRARPGEVAVTNAAVSSSTTSDLISGFEPIMSNNPTHVIAMIGSNDARRHGTGSRARMTSARETGRNLRMFGEMVRRQGGVRLTWLTPPPIDEARALRWPSFAEIGVRWRREEIAQVAGIVRRQPGLVVDVHRAFLDADQSTHLTADGVHPSVGGQKLIVAALVSSLAQAHDS